MPGITGDDLKYDASGYAQVAGRLVVWEDVQLAAAQSDILDENGLALIKHVATASAVNELTITNAATGTAVTIAATGTDSNISIDLNPKGTGVVDVGAADDLTVGAVIVPQHVELGFTLPPLATITEFDLWVAPAAYQVVGIRLVPSTLQGGALTGTVVKATGTATPVKTTTPMHTADALDFNAGAYTVQTATLSVTTADLRLVAGERIALDLSGAKTAGHAALSIRLQRI